MTNINFKCKKCNKEFDCEVGEVYFPQNINERLSFEMDIVCPNCSILKVEEAELTELGQSQVAELDLEKHMLKENGENKMQYEKSNEIVSLIEELKQYDNKKGYRLSYDTVKKKLKNTIKNLVQQGEKCVEHLFPLLEHEETWSCPFALEILKEIKSEKSILPLIDFIKDNEYGDYWENCDVALKALTSIGEPAVKPLLDEIKSNFEDEIYFGYLVEALTDIKHDDVYSFMFEILKDYVEHIEKYDKWLEIDHFVCNFMVQEKKEVLPLLKKLVTMEHLSETEQREIKATIEFIEDPEKFKKEMEEIAESLKEYFPKKENVNEKELLEEAAALEIKKDYKGALNCLAKILAAYPKSYQALFLKARINRKLGKPDVFALTMAIEEAEKQKSKGILDGVEDEKKKIGELYREMESTADNKLKLNFRCLDCGRRQNLKPGLIWELGMDNYVFEDEIMCRHCFSNNLELTEQGKRCLIDQKMGLIMGESTGVRNVGKVVYVDNKKMEYNKSYPYLLKRIKEEPLNGELYLRAGNSARKCNRYEDAIKHYKKAIELNPKLIAVYVNLVEIYKHRYNYYKIKGAKNEAILYLKKLRELYNSKDYSNATLQNYGSVIQFIRENETEFRISSVYKWVSDDKIQKSMKDAATLDIKSAIENVKKMSKNAEQKAEELVEKNRGILVFQSYHIFDKKTKISNILNLSSVIPIDPPKLCICGSGEYLKDCCFDKVTRKERFVANMDFATYSLLKPIEEEIKTDREYNGLVEGFKDDPRFYCEDETSNGAIFVYYGNSFFTERGLGNVIFGTIEINNFPQEEIAGYSLYNIKKTFNNKSSIKIKALSKNRFDSLYSAVKEHLE